MRCADGGERGDPLVNSAVISILEQHMPAVEPAHAVGDDVHLFVAFAEDGFDVGSQCLCAFFYAGGKGDV